MKIFSMMKGRNLINLFGIPAWLFLIWLGGLYYAIFILVSMVIALGEYYYMMGKKGIKPLRWMGMVSCVFIADFYYVQPDITSFDIVGFLILIVILVFIWELFSKNNGSSLNIAVTMGGILYIPILLGTAIKIRQFDSLMDTSITFAVVISVWACDSAAFIMGSLYGKKKIFPSVSPNKSWIGSISGLMAAIFICVLFQKQGFMGNIFNIWDALIFGIITGIFGQLGDFTESLIKRDIGVKDSGKILAGHGGVLDRFDSLIFAMPLTYLYLHFVWQV
tara:strand:- start:1835 stop:2665 length:831 start_codon:yes stop_codon:yes gene_type:complete